MLISIINANSEGTPGHGRCEKIYSEIESELTQYDGVEVIHKADKNERLRLIIKCFEAPSKASKIKVYRSFSSGNASEILQSAIYHSVNKYTAIKPECGSLPFSEDILLKKSDAPAVLLEVEFQCSETGFDLLALNIARGVAPIAANFIKAPLKQEFSQKCYYVKSEWDEIRCVTDRFYNYSFALKTAQLYLKNLYNQDGDCLAVYGVPPDFNKITGKSTGEKQKYDKKLFGIFPKSFRKHRKL